jgi:putative ubiquitin-RnfH superfamily antitoxin RatB of RatAB toxin-antitoxin module
MNIGVCYADADRQLWLRMEMPDGSSVEQAIQRSGILQRFPEIDLTTQKVGVYGRLVKLDSTVKDGDRIEIYRPIIADPRTVRRRDIGDDDDDD